MSQRIKSNNERVDFFSTVTHITKKAPQLKNEQQQLFGDDFLFVKYKVDCK